MNEVFLGVLLAGVLLFVARAELHKRRVTNLFNNCEFEMLAKMDLEQGNGVLSILDRHWYYITSPDGALLKHKEMVAFPPRDQLLEYMRVLEEELNKRELRVEWQRKRVRMVRVEQMDFEQDCLSQAESILCTQKKRHARILQAISSHRECVKSVV